MKGVKIGKKGRFGLFKSLTGNGKTACFDPKPFVTTILPNAQPKTPYLNFMPKELKNLPGSTFITWYAIPSGTTLLSYR